MKNTQLKALEHIYQDTQIHFLFSDDENVMVNATEMAKVYGKEVRSFLRLESTEKYINFLMKKKNIRTDVYEYNKENLVFSNNKAGTYLHRKVALKFAAWLDIEFEDWIYDTIENILFKHYNVHRKKIIQIEAKKKEVEQLKINLIKTQNESALKYIEEFKNLEKFKKKKSEAII